MLIRSDPKGFFFETWLEGSRQYANLDSYLIPKARWEQLRQTYCDMVGIPADGAVQLELKQAALEEKRHPVL